MDIGATSHMTINGGNLSSSYFNLSNPHHIIIGNGHTIPTQSLGYTILPSSSLPLFLNNVLHAPHLIKNLVYVSQFTIDNNVSVEFDHFDFSPPTNAM